MTAFEQGERQRQQAAGRGRGSGSRQKFLPCIDLKKAREINMYGTKGISPSPPAYF